MSSVRSVTASRQTLDLLHKSIREMEQQTTAAAKERDRKLAAARDAAGKVGDLAAQARDLRAILRDLDGEYYKENFGDAADPREVDRAALLRDGQHVLAFLEATPDLPYETEYICVRLQRPDTNEERRAAVAKAAQLMGCEVREYVNYRGRKEIEASRQFGVVKLYTELELDPDPEPEAADDKATQEAQQLLDAEQAAPAGALSPTPPCGCEAGESCPDCVPAAADADEAQAERALDAYMAACPTDGEDGGA